MQFSVRRGSTGRTSLARIIWRALVLATLAGVAVLLFSGTASAKTCKTGCEDAAETAPPGLVRSPLKAAHGLVHQPVRQFLGHRHGAAETTSAPTATPTTDETPAPAAGQEISASAGPEPTGPQPDEATNAVSDATPLTASAPSLDVADPVAGTVTDTVEAVVPAASTVTTEATELLEGQPLGDTVDTTTDAIADLGAAAVPAVAATVQTVDATTRQLVHAAQGTTTAVLDSAQQVVTLAGSTLQPVTDPVTGVLASALGGQAAAATAASGTSAEAGSGVQHLGGATLLDASSISATTMPGPGADQLAGPASVDGQVPTPPPEQAFDETSATDAGASALVLTGQHAAPVPTASGGGAANGGTTSPSATDLGKLCLDLAPAAPQPGFAPALRHSAHVPSAPVVEPAQSPD